MSTHTRAGVRAARALLSLVEENSVEELQAAESILGNEKELTNILQLLRKYKEHEEEPLTIERLREIVRQEILNLHLSIRDMGSIVYEILGKRMRTPAQLTIEEVINQAFIDIEATSPSPGRLVDDLSILLIVSASRAGPDHEKKVASLLRDLAIQALTENRTFFPTLHSLAQLRTQWAEEPLPYKHQEPRRSLATRLLRDVEHLRAKEDPIHVVCNLLREGMRSPADAEFAAMRRLRPKKANGE